MTSAAGKPVEIYLNDHLAGADAALELLDDMRGRNLDGGLIEAVERLYGEIAEDRDQLELLISRLGVDRERVKQALAELGESLSRAKLARRGSRQQISLLLDLETLSVGIWGKTRLWRGLAAAGIGEDELDFTLEELEQRGLRQLETVEEHRGPIAARALRD